MSGSRDDSSANSRFACSTSPSVAVGRQAPPPTDGSEVSCVAPVSARQHLRGILKALYHLLIFLNRQNYRYGLSIASNDLGLCVRCFHPRVDLVARKGLTENYRIILRHTKFASARVPKPLRESRALPDEGTPRPAFIDFGAAGRARRLQDYVFA